MSLSSGYCFNPPPPWTNDSFILLGPLVDTAKLKRSPSRWAVAKSIAKSLSLRRLPKKPDEDPNHNSPAKSIAKTLSLRRQPKKQDEDPNHNVSTKLKKSKSISKSMEALSTFKLGRDKSRSLERLSTIRTIRKGLS